MKILSRSVLTLICIPLPVLPKGVEQSVAPERSAWAAGLSPVEIATRVAAPLLESDKGPESYIADLVLVSLLALDDVTHRGDYLEWVSKVMRGRKFPEGYSVHSYETQFFCSLPFELIKRGQGSQYIDQFIDESRRYQSDVLRASDGTISFYREELSVLKYPTLTVNLDRTMMPILVDHVQEYVSRMAKTGWVSRDQRFYAEAAQQIKLLRSALRDPRSGLWFHGRGWYGSADRLVTTKWGRAQAWLLRGLVETLIYLPRETKEWRQVSQVLLEFAATLIKYQDADGFWHQVIDRPDSFQETSATALISYDLARATTQGLLPEGPYRAASIKAFEAVSKWKVSADGAVYGGSATLPPLASVKEYMKWETPLNDPHAVAAVIFSAVGRVLLENEWHVLPQT